MKKKTNKTILLSLATVAMVLGGCATPTKSLYQWEGYQNDVYEYFKGESKEKQIASLEQSLEKIQAKGNVAPPGLHAHLGLLYVETGNDSKGIEQLATEKNQYPESAAYIDFLLKKYQKQ